MNMSMFLITGIYFAMLSFSTMIANEVVYEKTSKVLSMILTSISTTEHFISKMIVAWLTVTIQTTMVVAEIVSIMMLRNLYDEGHGLLKILSRYKLIQTPALTFQSFIEHLDIDARLITILAISLFVYVCWNYTCTNYNGLSIQFYYFNRRIFRITCTCVYHLFSHILYCLSA